MSRRPPSAPPVITGLRHRSLIGSGGFADVFLFEETALRRDIAVKVLAQQPSDEERAAFEAEADVMAQLSSHPAIVPIYQVGVAQDGRPFLTMELCTGESLATRLRRETLPVPLVLETGVKVAAAVETAHRAGVLHRDIKPANILTTAFGDPRLADFGIAHVLSGADDTVSGFSVPWSPPEMFSDAVVADHRSDVWSLAATVYTLLAGRSPFEVPGGANDTSSLMMRIERNALPRITRADVSDELNAVLSRGMAKRVEDRHPTAMAFARALQGAQIEMRLPTTRIDVLDASPDPVARRGDDEGTSVRPITVIVPDPVDAATSAAPVTAPPAGGARPAARGTRQVSAAVVTAPAPSDDTLRPSAARPAGGPPPRTSWTTASPGAPAGSPAEALEPPTPGAPGAPGPEATAAAAPTGDRRRLLAALVVVAGLSAAALVVGTLVLGDDPAPAPAVRLDTGSDRAPAQDTVAVPVPAAPVDVQGTVEGRTAVFTWSQADPQPGDTFRWTLAGDGGEPSYTLSDLARADVDVPPGRRACIVVTTVRGGQQSTPTALSCAAGS